VQHRARLRSQGTSKKDGICQTCGQTLKDCTGHFGEAPLHPFLLPRLPCSPYHMSPPLGNWLHSGGMASQGAPEECLVCRIHPAAIACLSHRLLQDHGEDSAVHLQDLLPRTTASGGPHSAHQVWTSRTPRTLAPLPIFMQELIDMSLTPQITPASA
jgi:hypothetical protein